MAERDPAFLYYETNVALDVSLLNRLQRGCYLDLVQQYRRFHGYTAEQLRNILGSDYDACWSALELVLEYDDIDKKYHIKWLRDAIAERAAFVEQKDNYGEIQRDRITKYWKKRKAEEAQARADGKPVEPRRRKRGIKPEDTKVIPRNNDGNTDSIPYINTNTNEIKDRVEEEERGVGEEEEGEEGEIGTGPPPWRQGDWTHLPPHATPIVSEMVRIFVDVFPGYLRDDEKDFAACLQIAYAIAQLLNVPWQSALNGRMPEVLGMWKEIVDWIATNSWYRTKPLIFLCKDIQGVIQAKNNGTEKNNIGPGQRPGVSEARLTALRNFGLG